MKHLVFIKVHINLKRALFLLPLYVVVIALFYKIYTSINKLSKRIRSKITGIEHYHLNLNIHNDSAPAICKISNVKLKTAHIY